MMSIFSTKNIDGGNRSSHRARHGTLIPPIRLNTEKVEKTSQSDHSQSQRAQADASKADPNWLPLFPSAGQRKDSDKHSLGENDSLEQKPTRISLKRLNPISLFGLPNPKQQKIAHNDLDIVLDTEGYLSLFQQSQKWLQEKHIVTNQEQDDSPVLRTGNSAQSSVEDQQQQPLEQQHTVDILEEVLGETDYNARSRIIIPGTKRRDSLSSKNKGLPSSTTVPTATTSIPEIESSSSLTVSLDEPPTTTEATATATATEAAATTTEATATATEATATATEVTATATEATATTTEATTTEATTTEATATEATTTSEVTTTEAALTTTTTITTTTTAAAAAAPEATSATEAITTTVVEASIIPPQSLHSPESSATLSNNMMDTSLPHSTNKKYCTLPRQSVPVFGTPLQYTSAQREITRFNIMSANSLKHQVGKVLDIWVHPIIALVPDYVDFDDSRWHGSGKTLFLKQLLSRLEARDQVFNLAIVCYDVNAEDFLMKLIKPHYPVQRLNTVKKGEWDQEYGVVIKINKDQPISPKSSFTANVDLVIIMDIRVQPQDSILNMFLNASTPGPPPIISLVTDRSVELRLQNYISKLLPIKWRLPDQATSALIFDTSNDSPVENSGLVTYMVVDSVIRWIDSGMNKIYHFGNDENTTSQKHMEQPLPTEGSQQQSATEQLPSPQVSAEEHRQENEVQQNQGSLQSRGASPEKLISNEPLQELPESTIVPSLQGDLAKLFSHASLERLQRDLKSFKENQGKSSNQIYSNRSDDEDSFYSAISESLSDDNTSSKVQAVMDSLQDTLTDVGDMTQSTESLKTLKMEFDKKCLGLFQTMVSNYEKAMAELQKEYVAEFEKKLSLSSTSISTNPSS